MNNFPEQSIALVGNGVRLAYTVTGPQQTTAGNRSEGEPPILLHRPLGGSMALWGDFAKRLAITHKVIAFDPRGVGASSNLPTLYTTRDMANDALGLLDVLKFPRAHVFGLSLGAMVATVMAIDAPQRIARLVLASTLPRRSVISSHILKRAGALARCLAKPGVEAEACLVVHILSARFRQTHPERVRAIEHIVRELPAKRSNLLSLTLAAARHSVEPELRHLSMDILLLYGELDPIAGEEARAAILRDLPRCRLEVLEGTGHDISLEQPLLAADRVLAFLQ